MAYEVTIGIEIHCELKTKTKMFSSAPVQFDAVANTAVNEIDLAFPGTLPSLNQKAVEYSLMVCGALGMEIDPLLKFDRKNYFYSDLPKGYQITQDQHPVGKKGKLVIETDKGEKTIGITRLHMEEDTAKQTHYDDMTIIDFNRAGVPLIEIVSEPEMKSALEATAYVNALRQLLLFLDVSDVKMEDGQFRCDVNVSLAPQGSKQLGTKVEIKNLNSINNVYRGIESEIERQTKVLDAGQEVFQATYRFDEELKKTVLMRRKEGAVDYRYFPEPNLVPIAIDEEWINNIVSDLPELPHERTKRYRELGLPDNQVEVLVGHREMSEYYDEVISYGSDVLLSANYCLNEALGLVDRNFSEWISAKYFAEMIKLLSDKTISSKQAKVMLEELPKGKDPKTIMKEKNMVQINDESLISDWINDVLQNNPQVIEDYKAGKDNSLKFVMGQVMKLSKGQANPALANKLVKNILDTY
ncbi:MAG: Asp-tRNA(Asn)/Glu-tRNA(Gln) amidotransferase subunit GatB [Erysipelothrix sp.]|nr:Asp-tRNA(Asn)/Glu-tRNA(Gln) amidotransferase subunit GatB [Erysipelothrix sp.]